MKQDLPEISIDCVDDKKIYVAKIEGSSRRILQINSNKWYIIEMMEPRTDHMCFVSLREAIVHLLRSNQVVIECETFADFVGWLSGDTQL